VSKRAREKERERERGRERESERVREKERERERENKKERERERERERETVAARQIEGQITNVLFPRLVAHVAPEEISQKSDHYSIYYLK